jgi:hypothetical protein
MNKSTTLCGNILNIKENRITWKVININLKGKCPSGRQRTKHKKTDSRSFQPEARQE